MKKTLLFILCCISAVFAFANDGAFYAEGNQLIPINESDISVQKEVLTLNRVGNIVQVNVYYEFFNPTDEKELLVGFEAEGVDDEDPRPAFPEHPFISNFKVVINGEPQAFEVAHIGYSYETGRKVSDNYIIDGQVKGISQADLERIGTVFDYVYHFNAKFRQGLNIIQHSYDYKLSMDQGTFYKIDYSVPYVLTAANRWANNQIDDFTLYINMGDHISFNLSPRFFKSADEWTFLGTGKYTAETETDSRYNYNHAANGSDSFVFHIQEGGISFHKTNFHPDGELFIYRLQCEESGVAWFDESDFIIDDWFKKKYKTILVPNKLPFKGNEHPEFTSFTPEQRRIMKNMPFAYRGYVFNAKDLQDYFESTNWYIPNLDYKADMGTLDEKEQAWVEYWK